MSIMGKYYSLEKYLNNQCNSTVVLTFIEIEKIIEEPLPPSAYKYRAWWGNGNHVQADSWLNAGYKVDDVKMGEEVTFAKSL